MFCTRCNLILQASVCPLVCVPKECALRGEVRRYEMADLFARPRDPDPGAAAATNGRQPRARARSGGGEGWNVENFYILLDEEERT